jgi:hypothetical protein
VSANTSCIVKCGSLLKTLLIYGIVAGIVCSIGYQRYKDLENAKDAAENLQDIVITEKERLTPQEIAKRAKEAEKARDKAFEEKMRAYEQQMDTDDDANDAATDTHNDFFDDEGFDGDEVDDEDFLEDNPYKKYKETEL